MGDKLLSPYTQRSFVYLYFHYKILNRMRAYDQNIGKGWWEGLLYLIFVVHTLITIHRSAY